MFMFTMSHHTTCKLFNISNDTTVNKICNNPVSIYFLQVLKYALNLEAYSISKIHSYGLQL